MRAKTKKWLVIALAWGIILAGIVLMPLPGPGLLVVAGGVYLLSRKSEWARKKLERGQDVLRDRWPEGYRKLERAKEKARERRRRLGELLRR